MGFHKNFDILQAMNYQVIKDQIDKMQAPLTFGSSINILLITDRLQGSAFGLMEYFQNSTDISVDFVNSLEGASQAIHAKPFDFLIIVGYLRRKSSYNAIQSFRKINKYSSVIIYAILDVHIYSECKEYGIEYSYERFGPVDGFVSFMREIYDKDTHNMHTEVSPDATREQVRMEALRNA